jgi:hypothetical protein
MTMDNAGMCGVKSFQMKRYLSDPTKHLGFLVGSCFLSLTFHPHDPGLDSWFLSGSGGYWVEVPLFVHFIGL